MNIRYNYFVERQVDALRDDDLIKHLTDAAIKCGAARAAVINAGDITFRREFREACEQNSCGKYGRCWMCPPDVGDIDDMIARAKAYGRALVFQSVGRLEDSFDIEGMQEAAKNHNTLTQALTAELEPFPGDMLVLGAGACHVCGECTRLENRPCRYPEKAMASLEAYGIAVSELAKISGMNYINGENTVTFFGGILFR